MRACVRDILDVCVACVNWVCEVSLDPAHVENSILVSLSLWEVVAHNDASHSSPRLSAPLAAAACSNGVPMFVRVCEHPISLDNQKRSSMV